METHIIPEHEKDKHTESAECICEPIFHVDVESGDMVWEHQLLDWNQILDEIICI